VHGPFLLPAQRRPIGTLQATKSRIRPPSTESIQLSDKRTSTLSEEQDYGIAYPRQPYPCLYSIKALCICSEGMLCTDRKMGSPVKVSPQLVEVVCVVGKTSKTFVLYLLCLCHAYSTPKTRGALLYQLDASTYIL